jgi:hypothetical protein
MEGDSFLHPLDYWWRAILVPLIEWRPGSERSLSHIIESWLKRSSACLLSIELALPALQAESLPFAGVIERWST